jgi:hypothetical protein
MNDIQKRVLVILGMHRSGTSLTAQWLSQGGLNLGDRLLGSSSSNKFGHVEDMDFLELHEDVLASLGKDYDVEEALNIPFVPPFANRATELVRAKYEKNTQWGWKEPRTCLFASAWDELIPEARYLIVYRPYEQVVDSLMRREHNAIKRRRNIFARYYHDYRFGNNRTNRANHYLKVWIAYNRALLNFMRQKQSPQDYVLLRQQDVIDRNAELSHFLIHDWKFAIQPVEESDFYRPRHLAQEPDVDYGFEPETEQYAQTLTLELDRIAEETLARIA